MKNMYITDMIAYTAYRVFLTEKILILTTASLLIRIGIIGIGWKPSCYTVAIFVFLIRASQKFKH